MMIKRRLRSEKELLGAVLYLLQQRPDGKPAQYMRKDSVFMKIYRLWQAARL